LKPRAIPPFLRAVVVASALLLGGCGGAPTRPDTAVVPSASADQRAASGDHAGAAAMLEQQAKESRNQRDGLMLRAAEQWRLAGRVDDMRRNLDRLKRKRLSREDTLRLDLLQAELALDAEDPARAIDLATLPDAELAPDLQRRLFQVRADALAQLKRPLESAQTRARLLPLVPDEARAETEATVLATLRDASDAELQRALGDLPPDSGFRPYLERALRAHGAVPLRVLQRPTRAAGTVVSGGLGEGGTREGWAPHKHVALLLPLSGSLASLGKAVRDGFLSAYFAETGSKPEVRVYDTGDGAEGALAAARRAAADGAERIVGPLAKEQVVAFYEQDVDMLPMLALNFPDSGLAPPRGSQQFGLPPDEEAALAAQRAFERGQGRVAIIAAREDWAERAALAFRAQFEHAGGSVVGEARLGVGDVDLSKTIGDAVGSGVDAVFLALKPAAARLLVPQLRALGMTETPILATSQIYAGNPSRSLDRDLEGVEFCDAPWVHGLALGLPEREALARVLPASDGQARLFAFGMDAFRLLPYLDWLGRDREAYVAGASGQLSLDPYGRVQRGLAWLRFEGGVPRAADGALTPQVQP